MAWNDGPEEAHMILEFRPARNIDGFFETEFGLANDGKFGYVMHNGRRIIKPNPLQGAALCVEYGIGLCEFPVPQRMQLILFPLMAKCGRLFGIKGSYPKYDASSAAASPQSTEAIGK
jgi:hypothetical protein